MANYVQKGENLDYIPESNVTAGTVVVLGDRIGIVGADIAAGETGSVIVSGVFELDKSGSNAIAMGQTVYFDGTGITDAADDGEESPTAYAKAGYAAAAAAASAAKILVKID